MGFGKGWWMSVTRCGDVEMWRLKQGIDSTSNRIDNDCRSEISRRFRFLSDLGFEDGEKPIFHTQRAGAEEPGADRAAAWLKKQTVDSGWGFIQISRLIQRKHRGRIDWPIRCWNRKWIM